MMPVSPLAPALLLFSGLTVENASVIMVQIMAKHKSGQVTVRKTYSAAQVAEMMDISPRTLVRAIEEGKLHAVKMTGRWLIFRSSLVKFVGGEEIMQELEEGCDTGGKTRD